ncbi:MAG: hypothetical protein LUD19_01260 [Clostridia bacterium]|nr:hypothetical protein [Clostridia bacterium]
MTNEYVRDFSGQDVIVVFYSANKDAPASPKVLYGKFTIDIHNYHCYIGTTFIGQPDGIISIKPWYGSNVKVIAYEPLRVKEPLAYDGYSDFDEWFENQPEGTSVQGGGIDKEPEKPPLGLRPKFVVDEQRRAEIIAAIQRYGEAGKAIPQEWIDEYNSLCEVKNG